MESAHIRGFEILCQYRVAFLDVPRGQVNCVRRHLLDNRILLLLISGEHSMSLPASCTYAANPLMGVVDSVVAVSLRELKSIHPISLSGSKPTNLG